MLQKTRSDNCTTARPRGSARKREPARAAATEPAPLFNYSEEEWSEIEAAARAVRGENLPKWARKRLLGEACWYLAARSLQANHRRAWQKAGSLADKLRQVISGMAERDLELLARAGFTAKDRQAHVSHEYREDFVVLDRFKDRTARYAEAYERYPTEGAHFDNPKFMFQFKVLLIWTELGGELRISRHPKHGNVQGPLARFFRAVTVPVMGALAPSPESLPDIIRRQSRFLAFEATPSGKSAVDDMHRDIHQLR
jgi:hypothetical protein